MSFEWTLRVRLRPLLRPARVERVPLIYIVYVCFLYRFVYASICIAYVYVYINFFEIPVYCWATNWFFYHYWITGLDVRNFLTRRHLSARIFLGRHSLCLVLPSSWGFWFAMFFPCFLARSDKNFCFGWAPFVFFSCFQIPRCYLILHHRYGWQCLCIHLFCIHTCVSMFMYVCIPIVCVYVCTYLCAYIHYGVYIFLVYDPCIWRISFLLAN